MTPTPLQVESQLFRDQIHSKSLRSTAQQGCLGHNCTANDNNVVQAFLPQLTKNVAVAAEETWKEAKGEFLHIVPIRYLTTLFFHQPL